MAPAPTRHAHHGCWMTQLLALLIPLLPLIPQPRGLAASCFWIPSLALCLASQNFHHLLNQFPVLNILYLKYSVDSHFLIKLCNALRPDFFHSHPDGEKETHTF